MSKSKKSKTETVDRTQELIALLRARDMEIVLLKERKRELERTIVNLANDLSLSRNISRSESEVYEIERAKDDDRDGEYYV
jgi:hypothetical protein